MENRLPDKISDFDRLSQLLCIVCNVFEAHSIVLFTREDHGSSYTLSDHFSLSNNIKHGMRITEDTGLLGRILKNRKGMLVNNFGKKNHGLGYYEQGEEEKIRAFIAVPLENDRGLLILDSKRTYAFTDKDLKVLGQFGHLVSQFSDDNGGHAAHQGRDKYFGALQDIHALGSRQPKWTRYLHGFLDMVSNVSSFPYCFLTIRNTRSMTYYVEGSNTGLFAAAQEEQTHFPMKSGLIGQAYVTARPVFDENATQNRTSTRIFGVKVAAPSLKSVACLPVRVGSTVIGVLVLAHDEPLHVSGDLRGFLRLAADHLAMFLENLYLRNQLAGHRKQDALSD
jgi:transcriptional regulator with GAF, ATPase, and Fis domain